MDTHLIEHIIKIAEEKSITKAAEKLYLTQSALNQQLLKLERELGIPLFRRAKTEMIPTQAGEIYLKGAREILRTKSRTYAEISDLTGSYKGTLSIGMTPVRGPDMFVHVYPRFHKKYPLMAVVPYELNYLPHAAPHCPWRHRFWLYDPLSRSRNPGCLRDPF